MTVHSSLAETSGAPGDSLPGSAISRKIQLYVILPVLVLQILNSLDRVNVSFAALHMSADIGLGAASYGFGIGVFFCGYLLFQYPSAWVLRRLGFRRWIGLTTFAWGVVATAMALIQTDTQFYILRFLLGVAEAGFAPGILIFIRSWVPARYRALTIALTIIAIPISVIIGGPLSGWLMNQAAIAPIAGWRWMFLIEGLPTVILSAVCLIYFTDTPLKARWLSSPEKNWLTAELAREELGRQEQGRPVQQKKPDNFAFLRDRRFLACATVWFCMMTGSYTLIYWLPLVIKQFSQRGDVSIGLLNALPWIGLGLAMLANGWRSDRKRERFWHIAIPMAVSGVGIALSAAAGTGWPALLMLIVGAIGLGAAQGAFWAVPASLLNSREAGGGIVTINIAGNVAGIVGPPLVGIVRESTGSFDAPVLLLAATMIVGSLAMIPLAGLLRANRAG